MSQTTANTASQSEDIDGIETQLSRITMNAQDPVSQDPVEYMTTRAVSEATLAANWIRIFEHHHPTQMHVLDTYRESNQRIISFIRGYFAFSELNSFLQLDAIASDPHLGDFYDFLVDGESFATGPGVSVEYPDKTYASFEDWYSDPEKPQGWVFEKETQRLVPCIYWLTSNNARTQTREQDKHKENARSGDQDEEVKQHDADLSPQLEHMEIDK
ncbi:hypothetical protein P171DRAFT_486045 [Karstenula rhodostoma CBS 690.94]|uniref:Uncharacterized protein n=1 Tax=Karstenula rhodostoma CBS 690.94 TaxID=1392251 RepID=A0A9P4PHJ8_9PLEO|nr:hypothetical protein P171DRAFT_486045 [Karstenula rhodostoma CBS 690.94]